MTDAVKVALETSELKAFFFLYYTFLISDGVYKLVGG